MKSLDELKTKEEEGHSKNTWTMYGIDRPSYQEDPEGWTKIDALLSAMRILDKEGGNLLHILKYRFGYDIVKCRD